MLCCRWARGSFCQATLWIASYRGASSVTEVHSAAACAASAQSPSAALNGYDGTTPFYHTAYAASYTARSATRQATASYAASYALAPFRQGYTGQKIPMGKARKFRNKISVACNAIMSVQYVILYYIAEPICRGPNDYVHSLLEI